MKKLLLLALIIAGVIFYNNAEQQPESIPAKLQQLFNNLAQEPVQEPSDSEKLLQFAYQNKQSDLQVQGRGTVKALLPDDLKGSRHQRFILELGSGQTLLVAHNIDLAAKITSLQPGDSVEFFGVYEWNNKGGVIHWTHKDPSGDHTDGWLKHKGRQYK